MKRQEAFRILEEWSSTPALIRCELRYSWVIGVIRGFVKKLSSHELWLVSEGGKSDVTINFPDASSASFNWGHSALPGHGRVVVIAFGMGKDGPVDSVALAEIKPQVSGAVS